MIRDIRRQAPAARVLGEFAVRQGWKLLARRAGASKDPSGQSARALHTPRVATRDPMEPADTVVGRGSTVPFADYDAYTARQILDRAVVMTRAELLAVKSYEVAHRGRATVVEAVEELLSQSVVVGQHV